MRTLSFAALAVLMLAVATSHELLLAKGGKPECTGKPPACDEGERFSRQTCECVPKGKAKELVCHVETEEILNEETGEVEVVVTETVINVSVESAHIRKDKHDDCEAHEGAEAGDECSCAEQPEEPTG